MNNCCKKTLQEIQDELSNQVESLLRIVGNRQSVMEEAAYRRAEIILDVMETIKNFANKKS